MILTPVEGGGFTASGGKYYIGNGNQAGMVSVFGRRSDVEGPEGYVFFAADSGHERYRLVQNVVNAQSYVSQFELDEYPVTEADVLHTGKAAFHAALNTVNVGKFNLGFASVGICEHALYEAVTHASNRILYGNPVTDFPHVRQYLTDAYARLVAMRMFGRRATDYFRAAGPEDRRYLLYNPIEKMKVTTEGEGVINLLWDVIAAKGFEKDTYFEMAARDIRGPAQARGHRAREHGAGPEVHGQLLLQPGRVRAGGAPARGRRRPVPVRPGPDQRPGQDPVPRLAAGLRRVRRTCPTWPGSPSRPRRCARC